MSQTIASEILVHPNLDTQWWWEALDQGELRVPTCRTCDNRFFPPQAFCPNCGSADCYGASTSGNGKVYSWVVIHRAFTPDFKDQVPYAIVAVDLEDGGRLIGRYFGDLGALCDALPVSFKLWKRNGQALLGFQYED